MTPENKAKELTGRFYETISPATIKYAKDYTLIAVDEIIKS